MLNEVSVLSQERLHEYAGEVFFSFLQGSSPTKSCSPVGLVEASCAVGPSLPLMLSSLLDIAVTGEERFGSYFHFLHISAG